MQKNILLSIIGLFLFAHSASAQYKLYGFVNDSKTGESMIGTVVWCLGTEQNTVTNNFGYYSLSVTAGTHKILFTYPGHAPDTLEVSVYKTQQKDISLIKLKDLATALVLEQANKKRLRSASQPSSQDLSTNKVEKLPLLLGEVDVIKAAQLLPGIKNGTEGSSGFYVRGGGRDQNLVLLDGVPVYNQNHLFGFFSVFNNQSVNDLQLYKGSFPARFGGRLSSVLDVTLKEGNNQKIKGSASMGPIMARLNIDGPLSADKRTTFSLSGRRSYIDLLVNPIINILNTEDVSLNLDLFFYDFNAKVSHKIDDKRRLYLSYYQTKDVFGLATTFNDSLAGALRDLESSVGINWLGNTALARYTKVQENGGFANYSMSYTRYKLRNFVNLKATTVNDTLSTSWVFNQQFESQLSDINLSAEFDYKPSPMHHIRYGATSTFHLFKPAEQTLDVRFGGLTTDTIYGSQQNLNTIENALFIEDVLQVNKGTKVNVGFRLMHYGTEGKQYLFPEPRLALNEEIDSNWIFRMSYSLTNQPIHLLANSNTGLPLDIWAPSTANIRPQSGHQFSLGFNGNLGKGYTFIGEIYYRWLRNAVDYAPGSNFTDVQRSWEDKVLQGNGENYGLELFLQKQLGSFTGWASYTLSYANRQINGINEGREYAFRYDQRHNFSTAWNYEFRPRQSFGFTGVFGTGFPLTLPIGQYYDLNGTPVLEYGEKNNFRMDNFFRIDLNYVVHVKKLKLRWADDVWFNISLYNATAYANPFTYNVVNNDGSNGVSITKTSIFRFIPSFSYNISF